MKNIALAIFVKTPGLSPIKLDLIRSLGPEAINEFYIQSIKAIEEVILKISSQVQDFKLTPYWAIAEEAGLQNGLWQNFNKILQPTSGLDIGECLASIEDSLLEMHDAVLFMTPHQPHIEPSCIELAIEKTLQNQFVLGPCHGGGYYLYGSQANLSFQEWKSVSHTSDKAFNEFHDVLKKRGEVHTLSQDFKVNTEEDLRKLSHYLTKFESIPNKLLSEQTKLGHWLRSQVS